MVVVILDKSMIKITEEIAVVLLLPLKKGLKALFIMNNNNATGVNIF